MILLSFIIPTLEEEKVIEKLLRNLTSITTFEYEIIVSDGGSKDRTLEIAKKYASKIAIYKAPEKQTIGRARNLGAAEAVGEYLVFLDADVFIPQPDSFFTRALRHFQNDPKLGGLGGWLKVFPEQETWGDKIGYGVLSNWSFYFHNNLTQIGGNCGEFGMIKTNLFRKLGGYREDLVANEDFELFRRLAKVSRVKTDPKLLVYHTGRRPHAVGWLKLLGIWLLNYIWVNLFKRALTKEWKVIR